MFNKPSTYLQTTFILITCLINLSPGIAKNDCIKFDASITQKIDHLGFHRDINWLIEAQNLDKNTWLESSCTAAIMLEVPQEIFVNPDQADDLKRLGKLDIFIDGFVDVEAPAHEATKHTVYIYLNNTQMSENVTIKIPIHLRYQRSVMGGHGKVPLSRPSLLIYCPQTNQLICGIDYKVNAPASSKDYQTVRVWKNVTYTANFNEMDLLVPIGDLEHYPCVATLSCILGCVGCFYILSLLSYTE